MIAGLAIPLGIAMLTGGGFLVNEWSEGALAQTMGMGHHHMSDPPMHCGEMDGSHGNHSTMSGNVRAVGDCPTNNSRALP